MSSATLKVCRSRIPSSPRLTTPFGGALCALRATTQRDGSAVIITVSGEVDAGNEDAWRYLVSEMAATAPAPGPVAVDVRNLTFMGCCAFTVLAGEAERCRRRNVTLCLVSTAPIIARTVAVCGLRWTLPIHPTLEAALSRGAGSG